MNEHIEKIRLLTRQHFKFLLGLKVMTSESCDTKCLGCRFFFVRKKKLCLTLKNISLWVARWEFLGVTLKNIRLFGARRDFLGVTLKNVRLWDERRHFIGVTLKSIRLWGSRRDFLGITLKSIRLLGVRRDYLRPRLVRGDTSCARVTPRLASHTHPYSRLTILDWEISRLFLIFLTEGLQTFVLMAISNWLCPLSFFWSLSPFGFIYYLSDLWCHTVINYTELLLFIFSWIFKVNFHKD